MPDFSEERKRMVEQQLKLRAIRDSCTLDSMLKVPRHLFVPPETVPYAYEDFPLQIGSGQTISQPFIVAQMTQSALLNQGSTVLEIGTGSGYAAAVLSELCKEVYTVERIPELAEESRKRLEGLGYMNVHVKLDDGTLGWEEHGPYDAILVTAASPTFPKALIDQLKVGGRLIIPVGDRIGQKLMRLIKQEDDSYSEESLGLVRFVPLIGEQGW